MLHITRRVGETVVINNNIEITILEVSNRKVKLGCVFPKNNTVFRKELHDKIYNENLAAINTSNKTDNTLLPEPSNLLKKTEKK